MRKIKHLARIVLFIFIVSVFNGASVFAAQITDSKIENAKNREEFIAEIMKMPNATATNEYDLVSERKRCQMMN